MDDNIRKSLIEFLESIWYLGKNAPFEKWDKSDCSKWIDWLENQGGHFDYENANIRQKDFAPKVEPKFMVGDWVVNQHGYIRQIIDIKDDCYYCIRTESSDSIENPWHGTISYVDEQWHKWTIQDAKDGDVLCTYECCEPKIVFILKGTPKKHYALSYYCYYNIMYPHFESGSEKGCLAPNDEDVKPATFEQRDILFQKMHEAGYKWDEEKKECMAIPKFNVGDWINGYYTNYKVLSINNNGYFVEDVDGNKINILFENEKFHHLWTIQDAKDGDVLAEDSCIFIIQKLGNKSTFAKTYCSLYSDGDFYEGTMLYFDVDSTKPATKEQRDLLFEKMKENGYEWDAVKKECRAIPKFKVGDWVVFNGFVLHIDEIVDGYYRTTTIGGIPNSYDWNIDNAARLWTIKDAKDGDVLVYHNSFTEIIMLFKSWVADRAAAYTHFHIFDNDYRVNNYCDCGDGAHLATKEQRELLFRKMKEKGYEWNEEKKECLEIPKFKVGDWVVEEDCQNRIVKPVIFLITQSDNEKSDYDYRDPLYILDYDAQHGYKCVTIDGKSFWCSLDDEYWHRWTIKDAKDGDVLASETTTIIFKEYDDNKEKGIWSHCDATKDRLLVCRSFWYFDGDWTPASKIQRERLFQQIEEAGYEWDSSIKSFKRLSLGDILVASDNSIFISAGKDNYGYRYFVALSNDKLVWDNNSRTHWETIDGVSPATEEQQNLLFEKLAEVGYEWDRESNRLREVPFKFAKEGDVLVWSKWLVLFKEYKEGSNCFTTYASFNEENYGEKLEVGEMSHYISNNVHIASKEQHDLLYFKLAEAGYEWDKENKLTKKSRKDLSTDYNEEVPNDWRPTEEQMRVIDLILTNESMDDNCRRVIRDLKEQLNNLIR